MKLTAAVDIYVLHRRAQARSSMVQLLHSARFLVVTAIDPFKGSRLRR